MNSIGKIGILLVLGIVIIMGSLSCGGGISQEKYDAALFELADTQDEVADLQAKLTEAEVLASQYLETNTRYEELQEKYDASVVAEAEAAEALEALGTQYADVTEEFEGLQKQITSNQNTIAVLQNENAQLRAQLDEPVVPLPEITVENVEQALFDHINQVRADADLSILQWGKNLSTFAQTNNRVMMVSKVLEQYEEHWVPYQLAFIATGYDTVDALVSATMKIWQNRTLQYQDNILADDAIYGVVRVERSGDIFYITFMASNYA